MRTIIKTCAGLRPPHPQVNKPLNRGPAAPGPLLNTPQTIKTLKTIFIVMVTAAYLLNARYIILAEYIISRSIDSRSLDSRSIDSRSKHSRRIVTPVILCIHFSSFRTLSQSDNPAVGRALVLWFYRSRVSKLLTQERRRHHDS